MSEQPSTPAQAEALEFRAEVQQLLNILAHSLYTDRDIFLRELISNASDALHRIQFELLTNREVVDPDAELAIRIQFDAAARTLTISDTGIGMTREELIEDLGTIAHSGAMAFLKNLEAGQRPTDIIGQFGVGFYSVFMVADEVVVTSRSYRPDAPAWTWTSKGDSHYTLQPAEKSNRGTDVLIRLKEDAAEYASAWRLEQIIRKHSDFISFPIYVDGKVANRQTAPWRKAPAEVSEDEYRDFYRQMTLDPEPPLLHIHLVTDVPVDIRSILYVPRRRERGVFNLRSEEGLKLYSHKVLIQEYNKDLLPSYLRFVQGVVDSQDLPLNISRETIQNNRLLRQLQKALTGRLLKALRELAEQQPTEYRQFWTEFGPFIKEGVITDPQAREELVPLLRFYSSRSADQLIALEEYVAHQREGQTAIYYILGDEQAAVAQSPHLDAFRAHDLEVLYLTDPLDGFLVQSLREFAGHPFQNVDDAHLELPTGLAVPTPETTTIAQTDFEPLLNRFRTVLGERVVEVRESRLLKNNPCRLVSAEEGAERDLQRVRRLLGETTGLPRKIMELNRTHPLIQNLARLVARQPDDPRINLVIEQLFENLLLLEGIQPEAAPMVSRLQTLMEAATAIPPEPAA